MAGRPVAAVRGSPRSASPRLARATTWARSTRSSRSRCGPRFRRRRAERRRPRARCRPRSPRTRPSDQLVLSGADRREKHDHHSCLRRTSLRGAVTGRRLRRRPHRRDAGSTADRAHGPVAAWAFIAPVIIYLDRLLRVPALSQHRPQHQALHRRVVRQRRRAVRGIRELRQRVPERRPSARRSSTPRSSSSSRSRSSSPSAWHWRSSSSGISGSPRPAGAVPGAVAAAADRLRVHLVVVLEQRLGARELRSSQAFGFEQIDWLTSPQWSLVSVLIANIWIGIPFNLVIIYSGLQNISQGPLRGRVARRRQRLAELLADHLPAAAAGLRDHPAARLHLHAEGVRHHLDHDPAAVLSTRPPPWRPGPISSGSDRCCLTSAPRRPSETC